MQNLKSLFFHVLNCFFIYFGVHESLSEYWRMSIMISDILFCLIFCAQGLNMYEKSNLLAMKLGKENMQYFCICSPF
jgi:hypothetical protein